MTGARLPARGAALFVIALAAAALPPTAHAADCSPAPLASFDIAYDAILIPVTLNGQGYAFMVDTGGYVSTLSPGVIDTLRLAPATVEHGREMYMTDGTLLDRYVTVAELDLGRNKSTAVRFIAQPQQSRSGLEHFQGTLAPDFLHSFDLDFDFGHRKLNLMPPGQRRANAACQAANTIEIPFRTDAANHIVVPVKVDGVQTTAVVDSGASRTVMSQVLAQSAFHLAPGAGLKSRLGATARSLVRYEHVFKTLTLNGVEIDDLPIGILPDEMAKSVLTHHKFKMADPRPTGPAMNAYPVIIGIDVLRKIHLYVDYKNEMLYMTSANAAGAEAPAPQQTMP